MSPLLGIAFAAIRSQRSRSPQRLWLAVAGPGGAVLSSRLSTSGNSRKIQRGERPAEVALRDRVC